MRPFRLITTVLSGAGNIGAQNCWGLALWRSMKQQYQPVFGLGPSSGEISTLQVTAWIGSGGGAMARRNSKAV